MAKNGFGLGAGLFVAGAVAGATVALLSTPYSGRRMRAKVRHKIEDEAERLGQAAQELKGYCDRLFAQGEKMAAQAEKMVRDGLRS